MRDLLDGISIKDGLLDRTEPFHVESLISLGQLARAWLVKGRLHRRLKQRGLAAQTVEAHLASVYSKLSIRSRAELGARVAALAHQGPRETPDSVAEPAP
jgi:hypothetical protein